MSCEELRGEGSASSPTLPHNPAHLSLLPPGHSRKPATPGGSGQNH